MISLEIDNSVSHIKNLTREQTFELRELLSYTIPDNYFSGRHISNKRYLLTKKGSFPTGLLYLVQRWLKKHKHVALDLRKVPGTSKWLYNVALPHAPYPSQTKAVNRCLINHRGVVSMPTGTGKSLTMALLIHSLQLKTLVVVPNLGLKNQLNESFDKWFGRGHGIVVENVDSPALKTLTGFDVLIIDETHHVAAKTYRNLNIRAWNTIYYRFFFTATPFRSKDEEQLLFESVAGQVIYRISYKEAVENKFIVPVEAYYIEVPKSDTNAYGWKGVYKDLVVENQVRNNIILELADSIKKNKLCALILVREIAHGDILSSLIKCPFASGENEQTMSLIEKFNAGTIPVLIGTVGVLGEGVDTKSCEYVIIAGLGKSKNQFIQSVGRAVRRYKGKETAKVILFRDCSHKFTRSHFNTQLKILEEYYGLKASLL